MHDHIKSIPDLGARPRNHPCVSNVCELDQYNKWNISKKTKMDAFCIIIEFNLQKNLQNSNSRRIYGALDFR